MAIRTEVERLSDPAQESTSRKRAAKELEADEKEKAYRTAAKIEDDQVSISRPGLLQSSANDGESADRIRDASQATQLAEKIAAVSVTGAESLLRAHSNLSPERVGELLQGLED